MELAFSSQSNGFVYSRVSNPTVQYFENKVKNLTSALSVTALNSGMAAISNALFSIAYTGSNIVTSKNLFGNTYSFFKNTLASFGVETRFCDLTKESEIEKAIDENTCAVFFEIISNPQMEVIDVIKLSNIAHKHNVPVLADTTVVPFSAFDAKSLGVDIDLISSTKYISGGATSLGGLVIDYGNFDWSHSKRLAQLAKIYGDKYAFSHKLKDEIHRNLGAYMTPQVAYLQNLGLETLDLRYKKASNNCFKVAEVLEKHPKVKKLNYPGLPNDKYYEITVKQYGQYPGALLTFELDSAKEAYSFINKLKMIKRATNLFDNKTLVLHPYSTIYKNFPEKIKNFLNVSDKLVRLSFGIEDDVDLIEDILNALK